MAKKAKAKETKLPKDGRYIVLRDDGGGLSLFDYSSGAIYIYDGTEELEDAICGAYEEIYGEMSEEFDDDDDIYSENYLDQICIFSLEDKPEYIKSTLKKYHLDIETKEKRELARLKKKYEKN